MVEFVSRHWRNITGNKNDEVPRIPPCSVSENFSSSGMVCNIVVRKEAPEKVSNYPTTACRPVDSPTASEPNREHREREKTRSAAIDQRGQRLFGNRLLQWPTEKKHKRKKKMVYDCSLSQ